MNLRWGVETREPLPPPEPHGFLGVQERTSHDEPTILCIDAYQPMLNTLEIVLSKAGYKVATATSITEGLSYCSKHHVDVAIFDCSIHSGKQSCIGEQLRSLLPGLKIIVWSAGRSMQKRKSCRQVNFVKPVPANELVAKVEALIGS